MILALLAGWMHHWSDRPDLLHVAQRWADYTGADFGWSTNGLHSFISLSVPNTHMSEWPRSPRQARPLPAAGGPKVGVCSSTPTLGPDLYGDAA